MGNRYLQKRRSTATSLHSFSHRCLIGNGEWELGKIFSKNSLCPPCLPVPPQLPTSLRKPNQADEASSFEVADFFSRITPSSKPMMPYS